MFIDEARIRVYAGGGGNGCMAFRREKFVPRGGPSGGDGGRGGDIVMESSERHNTLVHFRFNPEYKAQRGRHGEGSNCTGKEGEGIVLKVPVGTIVYDDNTGEVVHDFSSSDDRIVIARGGRGGRGNQHFATPTHQAPREHELGRPGEERMLRLELKLLADVGLVGYPNVGKSTLISRISAARPKIADYAFTTLQPNLGVVTIGELPDEESYVVADIPGLIEGAHEGHGLGIQFLRHIERTRLLVHMVDVSDASGRPDPVNDFEVIMGELASFGAGLEDKPMMVVGAKSDVANPEKLAKLKKYCEKRGYPFMQISAVTGDNINKLKYSVGAVVRQMRSGSYEGPRPLPKPRAKELPVKPRAKKKAVAKKAAAKKPANQQKSASKRVAQSRRSQTARPKAGRKKATAAKPKKKLSLKQRARR
ncbi:MAG: GTP-binding protein Obg [Candidatus Angelobacter sp.]|jgi:GTP-binding protein|nr:GTP-binding protein Obg [Candidatus Angelobacter sp.]